MNYNWKLQKSEPSHSTFMIQALAHLKDDISVNSRNHLIKYVFFRLVFVLNTYDSCILEYMRLE